jgi:AraC-like DNA-binding protein
MVLTTPDVAILDRPVISQTRADHEHAIGTVISQMRANLDYPYTLDDFAEMANYSPFHFARMFRHVIGIPPGEFLAALRFEQAKELILRTDVSITDICFEVGFSSLGTFSARFKHLVGVSPADLRTLPERLEPQLAEFRCHNSSAMRPGATLSGAVSVPYPTNGHLYVGLFPAAIPQHAPVSGMHRVGPGPFTLRGIPPGSFRLLAAMYPNSANPMDHLLPGDQLLVGAYPDPIVIDPAGRQASRSLTLRPLLPTDPPILTALAPMALGI